MDPYPDDAPPSGYSCQTLLARQVNEYLHPGSYFCWFSTRFNAMQNGDDSNPIWLYLVIDRAVQQGGVNNSKIKDVKANLLLAVDKELRATGRSEEIAAKMAEIMSAPLGSYVPQLWKLRLEPIAGRCVRGTSYPDEFKILDLKFTEFQVIVE